MKRKDIQKELNDIATAISLLEDNEDGDCVGFCPTCGATVGNAHKSWCAVHNFAMRIKTLGQKVCK